MDGTPVPPGQPMETVPVDDLNNNNNNNSTSRRAPPLRAVSSISLPNVKSGIFGASSNLVNSIVGAGIIGIPYAIRQAGFVVGLLLLVLVAWLTDKSLRIIVELASFHPKLKNLGVLTYEDLMSIPFGKAGNYFVLVNMFILAYGAMVAYLLIIKDTIPTVIGLVEPGEDDFVKRELVMIAMSLVIILPLAMMRDMASLAFTSLLSVLADVVLVGFVIAFSPIKSTVSEYGGFGQVLKDNWINGKLFIGLGVLSTAMACQHSAFIVSGSLEDKTAHRWSIVTFRSITTATILCIMLGVTGYLGFLDETQGDVLNNFDADSMAANAGRALLAVTMFFTYPMESFVARHVLVQLIYKGDMDGNTVDANGEIVPAHKFLGCCGRRERITLVIYIMTLIPALIVNDLGPVLSLTGSLGASCIAYIGPGLVYLGINGDEFLTYCGKMLQDRGYKSNKAESNGTNGEVELPVVGDASVNIQAPPEAEYPTGSKPWWWWLMGFPIWTAIASAGAHDSRIFLSNLEAEYGEPIRTASEDSEEVIGAKRRDYYISMFFIVFGVIAMVVGVASNIYVEVHDVFYTPT